MTFSITEKEQLECKKWSYENFFFFTMVIYMGMANGYTQVLSYPPSQGLWTFFVPIVMTGILIKRNIKYFKDNSKLRKVVLLVSVWIIFQSIKYQDVYAMNLFLLYNIVMAYVIVKVYGLKIIILFEKYITYLSVVSLIVWVVYITAPNVVETLFDAIAIPCYGTLKYNAFIVGLTDSENLLGFRNVGFGQEPGLFSSYLIIALFFNVLINNFNYKNKHFIILFITLITTQSTTGYVAFGIIVLLLILNVKKGRMITIIAIAIALPTIIALPFMRDKIESYMYSEDSWGNMELNSIYIENETEKEVWVPQRLDGFVFECANFIHDPLLGYGTKETKNSYIATHISSRIMLSNGNIKVFSRYGIFFGLIFFIMIYKTGKLLYPQKAKLISWLFWGLYMLLSMSYELTTIPLLLSIWGLCYFMDKKRLVE